jgi:hypothetical protein
MLNRPMIGNAISLGRRTMSAPLNWLGRRSLPYEQVRQIPKFRFDLGGIGNSIRDLLAKELAISFAKPVNRNFERSL